MQSFRLELAARRLERVGEQARAFARRIGKPNLRVELEPNGVRMSRERWGKLWTSLVHVIRNAIDHGSEPAEEREGQGRPPGSPVRIAKAETGPGGWPLQRVSRRLIAPLSRAATSV